MINLGPYELLDVLGQGGLGQVWMARREGHEEPVALKFLLPKHRDRPNYRRAFTHELRAMTRLYHPCIVQLLDFGFIEPGWARSSQGLLAEEAPYLVMELASHGSLGPIQPELDFEQLCALVFIVLEALAHAHARGVIHRDIKPQNFLFGWRGGEAIVRLTDFGLSTVHGEQDVAPGWGTPLYMAPEQDQRRWREQGPWTDLYSLGRMILAIVCGTPLPPELSEDHPTGVPALVGGGLVPPPGLRGLVGSPARCRPPKALRLGGGHGLGAGALDGPRGADEPGGGQRAARAAAGLGPRGLVARRLRARDVLDATGRHRAPRSLGAPGPAAPSGPLASRRPLAFELARRTRARPGARPRWLPGCTCIDAAR